MMDNNNYNYTNNGQPQEGAQQMQPGAQPQASAQNNGTGGNMYANPYQQQNQNAYANPYQQPRQPQYQQYQTYNNSNVPKPKKERKGGFGLLLAKGAAVGLVVGLVAGCVFTGISYGGSKLLGRSESNSGTGSKIVTNASQTKAGDAKELNDVSAIAKEVMPSIVAITNVGVVKYQSFFGMQSYESESAGSGIIISQDDKYLYIVTNNHVVDNAETLTVQFHDDSTVSAEITGTDPSDDLAVVQVEKKSIESSTLDQIKVATVGDSKALGVGEPTIAIGNALGYGQSVTTGIVSALGRTVSTMDESTGETITNTNLIQTDAAINPGNSGGALLNRSGQVIGINSVKYSDTAVEGIGYAIPMSTASPIIEKLINHETIAQTAYLGIMGQDVSSDVANVYNMPEGVYISKVLSGSAAEAAGLHQGDIIRALDGTNISTMAELKSILSSAYREGDEIQVKISRIVDAGYKEMDFKVKLGGQSSVE